MRGNYIDRDGAEGNATTVEVIRRLAAQGDRARRRSLAWRFLMRAVPVAAAVSCGLSALSLFVPGLQMLGLAALAITVVGGLLVLAVANRDRRPPDDVVADLDEAAALGGAFRSAHWFASDLSRIPTDDRTAGWIAFHLETTVARAANLDWRALYPRPASPGPWLTAAGFAAATVVLFAAARTSPSTAPSAPAALSSSGGTTAPAPQSAIVPELSDLLAGVRAMKSGDLPSREELAAIGRALEIARTDPGARQELQALLSLSSDGDDAFDAEHDPRLANDPFLPLEWAYQGALARRSSNEPAPADTRVVRIDQSARDAAPQPGFTSLLFGRGQAEGGEGRSESPEAPGRAAKLAAALRREVVHASSAASSPASEAGSPRRATTPAQQSGASAVTALDVAYQKAPSAQPPPVPDARRLLVRHVFARSSAADQAAKK